MSVCSVAWVESAGWVQPGGSAGVTSVNGDTGPAVVLAAGDVGADPAGTGTTEAASAVSAHVALSDPHPQYLLEADSLLIREDFPSFVLGTAPAYAVLRTWTIPVGESFSAVGTLTISRGTGASVTTRTMGLRLNAKNQGTAVSSSSPIYTGSSGGDGPATQVQWISGGAIDEMDLTIRDAPGNTADITFIYSLVRVSP